jgi:hypothetical protein
MGDPNVQGDDFDPTVTAVSASLVKLLLDRLAAADGRIHAEDAISAAACVVAERCIAAAGEFDPSNHQFPPGSRVFSERINELVSGNQRTVDSASSASVVGVLRDRLVGVGYSRDEFPDLKRVFEEFAARIGNADEWGSVPLSVPTDNRPHLIPLMVAFETRANVDRRLRELRGDKARSLAAATLALADVLGKVKDVIDHRVALLLAIETVNGMAKTAPMTDEAYRRVARPGAPAAPRAPTVPKSECVWRRFFPWSR